MAPEVSDLTDSLPLTHSDRHITSPELRNVRRRAVTRLAPHPDVASASQSTALNGVSQRDATTSLAPSLQQEHPPSITAWPPQPPPKRSSHNGSPTVTAIANANVSANTTVAARCGRGLDMVICSLMLVPYCLDVLPLVSYGGAQGLQMTGVAGRLVLRGAGMLGVLILVRKLLTFSRWRDEYAAVGRFAVCFLAMLLELTVENCVVWLVSAGDLRKYEWVPGLQDNVALGVRALAKTSKLVAAVAGARAASVLHFLAALLALAFSVLWDQVPYSGFGIMSRVVLTVACSRVLRMACFCCTVLPNPRPGCYRRRFPSVPEGWWDTIKLGYTTIRGFGGCNDLIFSGHAAFWVLAPLAFRTYYPGRRLSTVLLWTALVHACTRDVLDEQHYSVDMLLAVVVTWAVWDWLGWVYPADQAVLPRRPAGSLADPLHPGVLGLILTCLVLAGVIVIGGKA